MNRRRFAGNSLFGLPLLILFLQCAAAQLVATKDLTDTSAVSASALPSRPAQKVPAEPATPTADNTGKQDCLAGFRDGKIVSEVPEKLRLEIVSVEPHVLHRGTTAVVTIRLKNVGARSVLVPWETPPVEPDIDPDTGNTRAEVANIHLSLATREAPRRGIYLRGDAVLSAAPSNRAQHTELLSGQWVEVKFKATIECASSDSWACQPLSDAGHPEITAHWWESLSTHEKEGCNIWRGTYESRTVDSEPLPVAIP